MDSKKQNTVDTELTDADFQTMILASLRGATVSDIANIAPETLEGIYKIAYDAYTVGNYTDAETAFRALCMYKHNEFRFWMGLAGSCQALEKYKEAIDAYSMAGVITSLKNPEPFLYAAQCYLKMGDKENAIGALQGISVMGDGSPAHNKVLATAENLLKLLEAA